MLYSSPVQWTTVASRYGAGDALGRSSSEFAWWVTDG